MINKLHFAGVNLKVKDILNPKSKHVEYLKANKGDIFALNLILGDNRRYATYIHITNISHPEKKIKAIY